MREIVGYTTIVSPLLQIAFTKMHQHRDAVRQVTKHDIPQTRVHLNYVGMVQDRGFRMNVTK